MSDQPTPEECQRIADALAAGRKIEAIKTYREATGKGLKEAKDFIDALIAVQTGKDPEAYDRATKSGCGTAALLCFAALLPAAAWVVRALLSG